MTTTNGNRKILDLKRWEFCTPAPASTGAGVLISSSRLHNQRQLYWVNNTNAFLYSPYEDGWIQLPSPGVAGTFGAGSVATSHSWSTGATITASSLTATAGTVSSITTNQTLARDLKGYSVYFLAGPNAGKVKEIAYNSIGTNAVITFTSSEGVSFSNASVYRLLTPRWYLLNAGAPATGTFRVYDFATNTFQTLANNLATPLVDGKLIATPSFLDKDFYAFASGTATGGTATTLQNSSKTWATNQWVNYQVIITSGTGAGQIRQITANDATSITVGTWTTNPSTDSAYRITGNDDFLYWIAGNSTVNLYRYQISTNTWTLLSPTTARGAAPSTGMSGHWIYGSSDSRWKDESSIINGRRLYSFRGGAGVILDYYDIPSNAWVNQITYAPSQETFTTGSKSIYDGENILYIQKENTGRWIRFDIPDSEMDGFTTMLYPQGVAVVGDTAFDIDYVDGNTRIKFLYMVLNTSNILLRCMVI